MSYGAVVHASLRERADAHQALIARSRESFRLAHEWAVAQGFSEGQAPFAAMAAATLRMAYGRGNVTAGMVRDRLRLEHPQLFEEPVVPRRELGA